MHAAHQPLLGWLLFRGRRKQVARDGPDQVLAGGSAIRSVDQDVRNSLDFRPRRRLVDETCGGVEVWAGLAAHDVGDGSRLERAGQRPPWHGEVGEVSLYDRQRALYGQRLLQRFRDAVAEMERAIEHRTGRREHNREDQHGDEHFQQGKASRPW